MSPFAVQLTRVAVRDLDRLPSSDRDQVGRALQALEKNPAGGPPRIKRLKRFSFPLYRFRSGEYHVLYRVDEALMTVMRVINRKDLEKTLRRLR